MGLFSRLFGGTSRNESEGTVHDFTYITGAHRITLVKPLDKAGMVFLSGVGMNVKAGDVIVVKGRDQTGTRVAYRLESVNHIADEFRAYGQQEHWTPSKLQSVHSKRKQTSK